MERLFRSLKTEWLPTTGYMNLREAKRDISYYLMDYYNWRRPHQHNDGIAPAKAEDRPNQVREFNFEVRHSPMPPDGTLRIP